MVKLTAALMREKEGALQGIRIREQERVSWYRNAVFRGVDTRYVLGRVTPKPPRSATNDSPKSKR